MSKRTQVTVRPLGTSPYTKYQALRSAWPIPAGWTSVAEVRHPVVGDDGLLLRHQRHGHLAMLCGQANGVTLRCIDERAAEAALARMQDQHETARG